MPGIAHLNLMEAERMLCPVRQLKLYIWDSERIWVGGGGMSADVYTLESQHQRYYEEPHKPTLKLIENLTEWWHNEVRALSASWPYNYQVALPDILSAAFWRSPGVFQNSYLRDMACIADGMSTMGPVVVAQQVVDPGHPLQWRHNDHNCVWNHQPRGCLLSRLFRRRSKKTSKLRVTGLCVGNSPGPVNSPHKGPVTRKMSPFGDVIMLHPPP